MGGPISKARIGEAFNLNSVNDPTDESHKACADCVDPVDGRFPNPSLPLLGKGEGNCDRHFSLFDSWFMRKNSTADTTVSAVLFGLA